MGLAIDSSPSTARAAVASGVPYCKYWDATVPRDIRIRTLSLPPLLPERFACQFPSTVPQRAPPKSDAAAWCEDRTAVPSLPPGLLCGPAAVCPSAVEWNWNWNSQRARPPVDDAHRPPFCPYPNGPDIGPVCWFGTLGPRRRAAASLGLISRLSPRTLPCVTLAKAKRQ